MRTTRAAAPFRPLALGLTAALGLAALAPAAQDGDPRGRATDGIEHAGPQRPHASDRHAAARPAAPVDAHPAAATALFPLVPDLEGHRSVAADELSWLEDLDRVLLVDTGLPGLPDAALDLARVRLPDELGGELTVDGEPVGPIAMHRSPDLSLWRGRVAGVANSDVFLAFSSRGSWGWVRLPDGRSVHLQCGPHPELGWERPQTRWIEDAALRRPGFERRFACEPLARPGGVDAGATFPRPDLEPSEGRAAGGAPGATDADSAGSGGDGSVGGAGGGAPFLAPVATAPAAPQQTLFVAEAVIETDFAYYLEFGDQTAATNYAVALIGACSDRYEQQAGCLWDLAHLAIYTSGAADPFSGTNPSALLDEMRAAWNGGNGLHNLGDFGLVLSGHGGGGVAYLDEVCDPGWAVGSCCSINAGGNFPVTGTSSFNWDFVVTTHEAGHIFDAVHTHQFCPPVDHCDANCDGYEQCSLGTLMSYCHTCTWQGVKNIDPYFHPANESRIRDAVVSANCLDVYTPPPTAPVVTGISPTQVPALVPDAWPKITLTGQNFTGVTAVEVDGVLLGGFPPPYTVVDDSTLKVSLSPLSKLGTVSVRVGNGGGTASASFEVVANATADIDMVPSDPSPWFQTLGPKIYVTGRPGDTVWLVASLSDQPSVLPGLVSLDIGANLTNWIDLGPWGVDPAKGYTLVELPGGTTSLALGTRVHVQGVVLPYDTVNLPLGTTPVQSVTVLF